MFHSKPTKNFVLFGIFSFKLNIWHQCCLWWLWHFEFSQFAYCCCTNFYFWYLSRLFVVEILTLQRASEHDEQLFDFQYILKTYLQCKINQCKILVCWMVFQKVQRGPWCSWKLWNYNKNIAVIKLNKKVQYKIKNIYI